MTNNKFLQKLDHAFLSEKYRHRLHKPFLGSRQTIYFDGWSLVHLTNGLIFGYVYIKMGFNMTHYYCILLVLHIIWEIYQMYIKSSNPYSLKGPNSITDAFIDTLSFMFGVFLAKYAFYKQVN
jgi:hypothetical protein